MLILEFLSDTVSFELGLLETIGYFVNCMSKCNGFLKENFLREFRLLKKIKFIMFYLNKWQNSRCSREDLIQKTNLQYSPFINSWKISRELIFANHQFWKISRELIFANRHFWGSKTEFIFANLAKIREIRKVFFPRKFLPLRYLFIYLMCVNSICMYLI